MNEFFGALILLALYFLPSIVALARSHRQTASILVINLFLGWTVIGWIVALAMAVGSSDRRESNTIVVQTSAAGTVYQAAAPETTAVTSNSATKPTGGPSDFGSTPPREASHEHQWVDAETTNELTGEIVPLRRCTSTDFG